MTIIPPITSPSITNSVRSEYGNLLFNLPFAMFPLLHGISRYGNNFNKLLTKGADRTKRLALPNLKSRHGGLP